jgi:predicted lipoprotein with Yx(FWY)xxD motif
MRNNIRIRALLTFGLIAVMALGLGSTLTACQGTEEPADEMTTEMEGGQEAEPTEAMMEEEETEPTEAMMEEEEGAEEGEMMGGAAMLMVATSDEYGDYVVDGDGNALYVYAEDAPSESMCTGDCADTWPPFVTEGDPEAGEGVDAMYLGTMERDDGSMQVTYNGQPLYHYSGDMGPEDTAGQGVADMWHLVSPAGEPMMDMGMADE